jgi:Tetracyclin repressor-like, C-terminal domain
MGQDGAADERPEDRAEQRGQGDVGDDPAQVLAARGLHDERGQEPDIGEARTVFTTVVSAAFSGLLADSGRTPAEVSARLISDRPLWSEGVYRRAHERGEIDLASIPEAVLAMPFDLMRHDLLMILKPISPERIRSIVDDLFLPLVALHRGGR